MSYTPQPLDTGSVQLPAELQELREKLAEHVHDVWAAGRIREGWRYGPQRDDERKTHPCLVAFEDLPESEKEYDRATAIETLKAILASGWAIRRSE